MSKLTISQVVAGRVAYAQEQATAQRSYAASQGERAARCAARGDYRDASDASRKAEAAALEAHMWEECASALLAPIKVFLDGA
jgi:hypothetical protein